MRYRIDGMLYDKESLPEKLMAQIISRIKILAHLDIAEQRVPQDGKFSTQYDGRIIDLRVSSFPGIFGEKVVIRILDRAGLMIPLKDLGMNEILLKSFVQLLERVNGFILVTGPTGSGKTTTLYAALSVLNNVTRNIITLEDPVEYNIAGITQAQVNPDIGFTFAGGIRSMLRQDPDIVMIGEIRDQETAQTAVDAALTGHLVLSTLNTNDAPAALMRLLDMQIEPFLINASVTGILAQRLARRLCYHCKFQRKITKEESELLNRLDINLNNLYEASGCSECFYLGYKGRVGIFELLVVSNELRSLVVQQPIFEDIYAQALTDGMFTMISDAKDKVAEGIISMQELARLIC